MDGRLPAGNESYRAFADQWSARPATRPDVAAVSGPFGGMTVYASWNGATGVHSWQVLTGASPGRLRPAALVPRDGFETGARVARAPYAAVSALDENGTELARSAPAPSRSGTPGCGPAGWSPPGQLSVRTGR